MVSRLGLEGETRTALCPARRTHAGKRNCPIDSPIHAGYCCPNRGTPSVAALTSYAANGGPGGFYAVLPEPASQT